MKVYAAVLAIALTVLSSKKHRKSKSKALESTNQELGKNIKYQKEF